jgi:hypothetical protein
MSYNLILPGHSAHAFLPGELANNSTLTPSFPAQLPGRIVFDYKQLNSQEGGGKIRDLPLYPRLSESWREVGNFILMFIERAPGQRAVNFILSVFLFLIAGSSLSLGQVAPRWEAFGGYSYLRANSTTFGYANNSNLNGFAGEVVFNIKPQFGVVLDGGGHYGSQLSMYNYMAGAQYAFRREKSNIFAHALFGKAQNTVNIPTATRNGFTSAGRAFAVGGGYDWILTPRITLRAVQADYLNTYTFGATQNDIRISTGVVVHFGQIGHRPKL